MHCGRSGALVLRGGIACRSEVLAHTVAPVARRSELERYTDRAMGHIDARSVGGGSREEDLPLERMHVTDGVRAARPVGGVCG